MNELMRTRNEYTMRQKLYLTILWMFRIDVILNNIIALIFCIALLLILPHKSLMMDLGGWHHIFYVSVQYLALFQVLRSAKKSLALPLITIIISFIGISLCHYHIYALFELSVYKQMLLVGALGMAYGIFCVK